jgi:hypothetical protein
MVVKCGHLGKKISYTLRGLKDGAEGRIRLFGPIVEK